MAQTFVYKVIGDTQPAVKGNEALDASINKVNDSSKKLSENSKKLGADTQKAGLDAQKAFGEQLDIKIKATDARIKTITGTIGLATGAISTVVGALGLIGIDDEQLAGFQKATLSVLALGSGAAQAITGFKDLTEAKKLANEVAIASSAITKTETAAEVANTAATATNTTATVAGTAATNTANTATKAFNATILKNPYVLAAAAIAALTAGIYLLVQAQKDQNNELEKEKKLRENLRSLYDAQDSFDKQQADNYIKELELQGKLKEAEDARVEAAIRNRQTVEANAVQTINELKEEQKELEKTFNKLKEVRDSEASNAQLRKLASESVTNTLIKLTEIQNKIFLEDEKIAAAELAIEEERQKIAEARAARAEAARKKRADAAEALAIRAAKQLKDEQEALENLIALTEELAILDGSAFISRSSGQFEFNTELDRTNFLLKEQLDVLFALNTEYEDLGDQLEEFTDDVGESFFSETQLEVFKKLRDAQKTGLQLQLEDLENTYKSDLSLFSDNEEMKSQITEQYEDDRAKLRRQFAIQTASDLLGISSRFLNTIAQVNQASLELQLAQAAGNQAAIEQINKQALERQKKLRIAQILVSTAESVINAFTSTSQIPPPFGQIIGAALAASYVALGAKSIQTVNSTTLDGSSGGGGFNNIPGGGFGSISLPGGGGISTTPSLGAILPGLGGGRIATPSIGTVEQEPIRAYVLSGDVSNGMQAGIALNNRRRLSGG